MSVSDMFKDFLANLAINNTETISKRYGEITSALNKQFRDTESKTSNTLQVGSFGRKTGINGISDLDMLYIMPKGKWDTYKDGKQLQLLQDTKAAILARYPKTKVKVDRLVVTATYTNFHVEAQPVFEQDDGSFKYPDTYGDGKWLITKPRPEMKAIADLDAEKNGNLRPLCKMARAWKNLHGVGMGGLLLDTLAHNFLKTTDFYDDKSYLYYDFLSRDFFEYLSNLPNQDYYAAPGSGQRVKVKKKFQAKAKKAYYLCIKAIEAEKTKGVTNKWKKVYGRPFPANKEVAEEAATAKASQGWRNTEQFIENQYPIDIRHTLTIDCKVTQNGFREQLLRTMLAGRISLLPNKKLHFWVTSCDVPEADEFLWKILNRGDVAKRRDCIRGQIVPDKGHREKDETTNFKGDHVVECYAVKNGVIVAKDRILVPIKPTTE